jgi:hypothetical protein
MILLLTMDEGPAEGLPLIGHSVVASRNVLNTVQMLQNYTILKATVLPGSKNGSCVEPLKLQCI